MISTGKPSSLFLCCFLAGFTVSLAAEETLPESERMWGQDFGSRQRAMHQLWRDPAAALEAVERAASSDDPEVAARGQWILDQWRVGVTPQTPPGLRDLLRSLDTGAVPNVERLLQEGQIDVLIPVLESGDRRVVEQVAAILRGALSQTAFGLLLEGKDETLARLLDLTAIDTDLVLRRAIYLRGLGRSVDECLALPAATESWPAGQRRRCQACLAYQFAQVEQALQLARPESAGLNADDDRLYIRLLAEEGRWETLATFATAAAEALQPDSAEAASMWGMALTAARRADLADPYDRALDQVRRIAQSNSGGVSFLAMNALLLDGRIEEVLDLAPDDIPISLARFFQMQGRYREAIEQLGARPIHLADDLSDLIDLASKGGQDGRQVEQRQPIERAFELATIAMFLNEGQPAKEAFERISRIRLSARPKRVAVVRELVLRGRNDWAVDIAVVQLGSASAGQAIADSLAAGGNGEGEIWLAALAAARPGESTRVRARQIIGLSQGRLPEGWNNGPDLDELALRLHQELGSTNQEARNSNFAATDYAEVFLQLGREDLAEAFFRRAAGESYRVPARLLEHLISEGRWSEAVALLEKRWTTRTEFSASALLRLVDGYRNTGQLQKAVAYEAALAKLPLSADERTDLARAFSERDLAERALENAEIVRRQSLGELVSDDPQSQTRLLEANATTALMLAAELQTARRPEAAARMYAVRTLGYLDPIYARLRRFEHVLEVSRESRYYAVNHHRYRGLAAARDGNAAEAQRQLAAVFRVDRDNIEVIEAVGPKLRDEYGMPEVADQLVDEIFEVLSEHARSFPGDPSAFNNAAWVAAINDRHLEQALQFANRAVLLEPDSTAYRDTLAEVLYRLGRVEEAIAIEEGCLLDEPAEWHVHEQLERFRTGYSVGPTAQGTNS